MQRTNLQRNQWSWVNPKLSMETSPKDGLGHFATCDLKKDEPLICWTGRIITGDGLKSMSQEERHFVLQVDEIFFQVPFMEGSREPADYINHSCEPNAGFGVSPITLVALRDIKAGEEVTHDYCMESSYDFKFECNCGTSACRKRITGDDWKLPKLQSQYRNYFSPYLWKKIQSKMEPG